MTLLAWELKFPVLGPVGVLLPSAASSILSSVSPWVWQARKSKSGRSNTSETRSNTSGRSRRSKRSSRSQTPLRPVQPPVSRFEIAASSGGEAVLPSQKWQSLPCCAGGCCAIYGCCVPCAIATARHRMDGSSWCVNFWCLNIISARNIVRHGYSIKGHCCADVMCGLLCTTCVACQLLEETNRRGSLHDDWSATPSRPRYQQPWKFGLLKCTDDMSTCTYGCCCPLLGAASARTQMDESDWIFNMCCMNPIITRTLIRQGYNIEGTDCQDCCLTCFCLPCSVCQMLNETQHRGRLPTTAPGYNPMAR